MWKFLKLSIKFIIIWKFTIWFFDWLGIPILNWILNTFQFIQHIINISFLWLISGTDGAIITDVLLGLTALITIITVLCIKYCEPSNYNTYDY